MQITDKSADTMLLTAIRKEIAKIDWEKWWLDKKYRDYSKRNIAMLICANCHKKENDGDKRITHYHICDNCRIKLEIGEDVNYGEYINNIKSDRERTGTAKRTGKDIIG